LIAIRPKQPCIDADYVERVHSYVELKERVSKFRPSELLKSRILAKDIVTLAREYVTSQPSVIRLGVALEKQGGQRVRQFAVCR